METVFKKYFWVINLVFLLAGAWALAGTVNVVLAHKLRTLPTVSKTVKKKRHHRRRNTRQENNRVIVDRNLFESAMAEPAEPVEVEETQPTDFAMGEGDGVQSSLRATLVGTIVASDPRWSMALITDLESSETGPYRVRDRLMNEATVIAVHTTRVVLNHNGVREYLELQEEAAPKTASSHIKHRRYTRRSTLGEGVKKVGENSWVIDRAEIDKTLSNLNSIAMQARIVPSFKNGEANGFKLFAIRPGSVYSKLGIQNGDIIHKINGYPINSPDKALEIYQKLKSARNVDIELTRRGKDKKLNYRIE